MKLTFEQRMDMVLMDLDAAAMPTKCEVFSVCGSPARELADDVRALVEALENVQGLIDTPLARRLFNDSDFYNDTLKSVHKALGGEA